ncbi:hypothetical protein JY491_16275, partial [Serratia marcescens]
WPVFPKAKPERPFPKRCSYLLLNHFLFIAAVFSWESDERSKRDNQECDFLSFLFKKIQAGTICSQ